MEESPWRIPSDLLALTSRAINGIAACLDSLREEKGSLQGEVKACKEKWSLQWKVNACKEKGSLQGKVKACEE